MARYYYLGPWTWSAAMSCWLPPEGAVGLVDLRSLPQQAAAGTPQGYGFFATEQPLGSAYEPFGTQLDATLTPEQLARWRSMLGLARLDAASLLDALWETLTAQADPDGQTGPLPLDATSAGTLELHLGGHSLVKAEPLRTAGEHWRRLKRMLQRIYKDTAKAAREGRLKPNLHRMMMTHWLRKYRLADYHELLPEGEPDEPPVTPQTTITDDFTRADGDIIGHLLTWAEYWPCDWDTASNMARLQTSSSTYPNMAVAQTDLSSSDHYSQVSVVNLSSGTDWCRAGAAFRCSSGANTTYSAEPYQYDDKVYLYKWLSGTLTVLGSASITLSLPGTVKGSAEGSTIKAYWGGVQKLSVTDTGISGNTRCGMAGKSGDTNKADLDDFEAGDLAAAAAATVPWHLFFCRGS